MESDEFVQEYLVFDVKDLKAKRNGSHWIISLKKVVALRELVQKVDNFEKQLINMNRIKVKTGGA